MSSLAIQGVKQNIEVTIVNAKESGFTCEAVLQAVTEISEKAFKNYCFAPLYVQEGYFDPSKFDPKASHAASMILLAISANKIVGFIITRKRLFGGLPFKSVKESEVEFVDTLAVEAEGNGIGTKLGYEVARRAVSLGKRYIAFSFLTSRNTSGSIGFHNTLRDRFKVPCMEHRGDGVVYRLLDLKDSVLSQNSK